MDITINRFSINSKWQFRISTYRKSATADCIIPYDSCHPIDRRLASIRCFTNRRHSFDLLSDDKGSEKLIISTITGNSQLNLKTLLRINRNYNELGKEEKSVMKKRY